MSKQIRKIYTKRGLKPPNGKGIHTPAFHKIVAGIKASGKADGVNPYAIAMSKLGRNKAVKKSHRTYKHGSGKLVGNEVLKKIGAL